MDTARRRARTREPDSLCQSSLQYAGGDDCAVRLVTTCEFLEVFMVREWCDNQMVELTALVATRATTSLFSNETGECWLQHRDEADSVCFASQWRLLHTASTVR